MRVSDGAAEPRVLVTDEALAKIQDAAENFPEPIAGIRLSIAERGPDGFKHRLTLVDEGEEPADDLVQRLDEDLSLFVDSANLDYLDGVTIDFDPADSGANGFVFDNPNPLWIDDLATRLQELIDQSINPGLATHGGYVTLLDVKDRVAYLEMGGGCQGCGLAAVTLTQGIETAVREALPEIERIVDKTDHAGGDNPYYAPEKK
jgi:Fe/S biogenesis protein NfuA